MFHVFFFIFDKSVNVSYSVSTKVEIVNVLSNTFP